MSQLRPPMVWSGGLLVSAGLLLIVARLIGVHEGIPSIGDLPILHYYGAAVGAGLLGMLLLMTAPRARRARNRVRLDERPVQEAATLRPKHQPSPTTTGFAAPKPAAPEPPIPQARAAATTGAATQTVQTEMPATETAQETTTKSTWGSPRGTAPPAEGARHHPNDPHAPPRRQDPSPFGEESQARRHARRHQLSTRLEELEQKANQAKVRYGLGKVSAAGYRQYLAEVDRERMMIETELMEGEE